MRGASAAVLFGIALLTAAARAAAAPLPLLPYPRQVTAQAASLRLSGGVTIAVASGTAADRFAARLLAGELKSIDHLRARISGGGAGTVVLARADSVTGRRLLHASGATFPAAASAEGYLLWVTPRRAVVVAESSAGLFYGVETLRQLLHPAGAAGATAPAVRIVDWPALRWRGVSVDLSRGAIPTLAAFKRDLDMLAELKINAYMLYFENTFRYQAYPVFSAPGGAIDGAGAAAGAIDAAEAQQIVTYAAARHITVIPEQESFGHLHLGLQAERFQNLLELPYGSVLAPGAPGALDMIGTMFGELAQAFPGPFFHIGADETAELGEGRSQAELKSEGYGPLYLNYVKAIDQRLQPYHRKIIFWGDMAQQHPELLHELPTDMIAMPWVYSPRPSYVGAIKPFTDARMTTWVAPGVSNWSRIFPDYAEAIPNIQGFVRDGRSLGAVGMMNTVWDDDGESMFDYTWYGVAYGAAAGWEDAVDLSRFQNAYDWAIFRADGHAFSQEIQDLTTIHTDLEKSIHADGADRLMWHQAFSPTGQKLYGTMAPTAHTTRLLAENVIASVEQHRAGARRNALWLDPVEFAARRFDFVGEKAIYAGLIASLYADAEANRTRPGVVTRDLGRINSINGLLEDMRDHVTNLEQQYRTLWLESNTPYFLDNILLRYQDEAMYWQHQARRFTRISTAYAQDHKLPLLFDSSATDTP
jgi:hypothetical protein